MRDLTTRLDRAAAKALERQNKIFQFNQDPSLIQYEKLKSQDFDTIARAYGPDALTEYVTAMESRRMKGGR